MLPQSSDPELVSRLGIELLSMVMPEGKEGSLELIQFKSHTIESQINKKALDAVS